MTGLDLTHSCRVSNTNYTNSQHMPSGEIPRMAKFTNDLFFTILSLVLLYPMLNYWILSISIGFLLRPIIPMPHRLLWCALLLLLMPLRAGHTCYLHHYIYRYVHHSLYPMHVQCTPRYIHHYHSLYPMHITPSVVYHVCCHTSRLLRSSLHRPSARQPVKDQIAVFDPEGARGVRE